jgi:hypothetical protein
MTTTFWINNPMILFQKDNINQLWPKNTMTSDEKLNAITRLIIILTVLGYLITNNIRVTITGIITLAIIILLYFVQQNKESKLKDVKEGFTSTKLYTKLKDNFTNPTVKNPLMNVLLPEIKYDPNRKSAAPAYNRAVEKQINKCTEKNIVKQLGGNNNLEKKLFANLGDSFNFENDSMHTFYATPNTKIPNDQEGFANFCYGDMISSKEGNPLALERNNLPKMGSVYN